MSAFYECTNLELFSPTISSAFNNSFTNCKKLKKIKISEKNDIYFGGYCFLNCISLDIEFPSEANFVEIGDFSFKDCHSFKLFKLDNC